MWLCDCVVEVVEVARGGRRGGLYPVRGGGMGYGVCGMGLGFGVWGWGMYGVSGMRYGVCDSVGR